MILTNGDQFGGIMARGSTPSWNFFGTVERLVNATEALFKQQESGRGFNAELAGNMIARLSVIMEDATLLTGTDDQERRERLRVRVDILRAQYDRYLAQTQDRTPSHPTGSNTPRVGAEDPAPLHPDLMSVQPLFQGT